jgi:hypothetical protein
MPRTTTIYLTDAQASYYRLKAVTAIEVVEALARDGYYKIEWGDGTSTFVMASGVYKVDELEMGD